MRPLRFVVLLAALVLPPPATAAPLRAMLVSAAPALRLVQVPAAAAPGSAVADFVRNLVEPALLRIAIDPMIWAVLLFIAFLVFAKGKADREAKVRWAINAAYAMVEDLKATGKLPTSVSKPVVALEKLKALLDQQGVSLTDAELELAKMTWSAIHGQSKADATPKASAPTPIRAA